MTDTYPGGVTKAQYIAVLRDEACRACPVCWHRPELRTQGFPGNSLWDCRSVAIWQRIARLETAND